MTPRTTPIPRAHALHLIQQTFLTKVLPRVEAHGRVYFRHVRCPHRKEELQAELRGLAWKWFVRLVRRGKNVLAFVSTLATYAARAAHSGRRVCGHERSKDVLSPIAQRRYGFVLECLPDFSTLNGSPLEDALQDNTRSAVPDQVSFRLDFPAWCRTRTDRDRRLINTLMLGERTMDVSDKFKLSPARVSQLRRDFCQDWRRFCGEAGQ